MNCSLYIHIPFCVSKCIYCDFFSIPHKKIPDSYINALCNEILYRYKKNHINELKTIYIGGGTPSLLSKSQLNQLLEFIKKNCNINKSAEITIEVNPDDVSEDFIDFLSSSMVNRLSLGIQSMNDKSLKFVHRRGSAAENLNALQIISKKWKKSFSVDLICGIPGESEDDLKNSIATVCFYNPDHISMYSLTIEEETPLGIMYEKGIIDYDFDDADNMWISGRDILEQNGYFQYEVSNFAKKGFESLHNLTYWNHSDYLGCGSCGTGTIYLEDGNGFRWTNTKNIDEYIDFWNEIDNMGSLEIIEQKIPQISENIDLNNSIFEFFMMGLRKLQGISKKNYSDIFGSDINAEIIKLFHKYNKKGLCEIDETEQDIVYRMNKNGILFLNPFLQELMAIL